MGGGGKLHHVPNISSLFEEWSHTVLSSYIFYAFELGLDRLKVLESCPVGIELSHSCNNYS